MKTLLLTILFAGTGLLGQQTDSAKKQPASQAHALTRAEFDELLAKPDQLLIIDVRRPDEIASQGGFPVYLNIQAKEIEKSVAWIPKDRTIVTVSIHAVRAGRAADILTKAGLKVAGTIGTETYEQAGGKLIRIEVPKQSAGKLTSPQ